MTGPHQSHFAVPGGETWEDAYRLGLLAGRSDRLEEAQAHLQRALAAASGQTGAEARIHTALAALERRQGRVDGALIHYRAAADAAPHSADASLNLGAALGDAGRLAEAAAAFDRAARQERGRPEARRALASTLNRLGRSPAAETVAREGLSAFRSDPPLLGALAAALQAQGRPAEAVPVLEALLEADPANPDAAYNLGVALKADGRVEEARAAWLGLLRQAPGHAAARLAVVMAELKPFYADEGEVLASRKAYAAALEDLAAWADAAPPAALAEAVGAAQPFDLPYQGWPSSGAQDDDLPLQQLYGAMVARALAARYPPARLAAPPSPGERIRVGVVSGFFRHHANWRMPVRGWVEGLDRRRFQLLGYHTGAAVDGETEKAASLFHRFVQGPLSTEGWRAEIAADRPHVLIYPEIGMDPMAVRLAGQRLAPVQCASWGHPVTSGLPTIDLYLSSAAMEPPDAQRSYSERLVALPGLSTPVRPDPAPPRAGREALGWPPAAVIFWCGQSPYKYLPRYDDLFARIAAAAPGARFVFAGHPESAGLTERFRQRLHAAFSARDLDGEASCIVLPRLSPDAFLAAMGAADIALDSPGWSGCNSLLDALACRLPVVALQGTTLRGRHGSALLHALGLGDQVSLGEDAFVEQAVSLARSPERRAGWIARLPRDLSAALADHEPVRALELAMTLAVDRLRGREPSPSDRSDR